MIAEWKKNGTFIHQLREFYLEGDFWGQLIFAKLAVRVHVVDALHCFCIRLYGLSIGPMEQGVALW